MKTPDDSMDLLPEPGPVDRKVFLPVEAWAELSEAAKFESEAYARAGIKQTVSRNDMVAYLAVTWGLPTFWKTRGGKPTSPEEREERLQAEAARLKSKLEERKAAAAAALKDSSDK